MSRQGIRARIMSRWARNGFQVVDGRLARRGAGIAQAIECTMTRLSTLEVELRQWMAIDDDSELALDTCDVRGFLGVTDGTRHLAPQEFERARLEVLSDSELDHWCRYAFETAIQHVFEVLAEPERVDFMATSGLLPRLSFILGPGYQRRLGLTRDRGAWAFAEGSSGWVDPVKTLRELGRHGE